jgi:polar amino acid transport system substrate-binding protein
MVFSPSTGLDQAGEHPASVAVALAGAIFAGVVAAFVPPNPAINADGVPAALEGARRRGAITVGVDYVQPPITLADYETRRGEGFEALLAEKLAEALGGRVDLVTVKPADRVTAVEKGEVDLLLVRIPDTVRSLDDFEIVDTGYTSGLMPLMRSDTKITDWTHLAGRTVCVAEGNAAARALAERHGASVRVLKAPAKSLAETRTGACDAAIHDEAALRAMLKQPNWEKFSATLPAADRFRLAFAIRSGDRISRDTLGKMAAQWSAHEGWSSWEDQWGADVAFEVYLEQNAPDCH